MTRRAVPAAHASSDVGTELKRLGRLLLASVSRELDRSFGPSGTSAGRRRAQALFSGALFFVLAFALHAWLRLRSASVLDAATGLNLLAADAWLMGWRILLLLSIASSLVLHIAGMFVADIFELKDPRVAWTFVGRLASGARGEVLHLREGRLSDENRKSPILQIGGPGRVVVDYDTAALFEGPDGVPRVAGALDSSDIGGRQSQGVVELDGFERLREPLIGLRDQYIGHPSADPLSVVGRSLDGLPIGVTDVRGVFSVRREVRSAGEQASLQRPFPFRARDIENLIYKQPVQVLALQEHASGVPGDWTEAMYVLIRESLREFMASNRLSEFLAGVGANEAERSEFLEDTILTRTLEVSAEPPGAPSADPNSAPRFRPRTELSSKFRKHNSEFSTRAQELGLELHWIGVGTWKMPEEHSQEAVSAKHIEAWSMNRENTNRLQSQALEEVADAAVLESKLSMVQEIPLARHARNQARYSDKLVLMECLLQDFWEQLGEALDTYYRSGTPSAALSELEGAVAKVEELLRISQIGHVLGGQTRSRIRRREDWDKTLEGPPAPASRAEATKYQALLSKLKGDHRVAEAMIANEKRRHDELDREQLISRIVERFERHGRESNGR